MVAVERTFSFSVDVLYTTVA